MRVAAVLGRVAWHAIVAGDLDTARESLDEALAIQPLTAWPQPDTLHIAAMLAFETGDFAAAEELLQREIRTRGGLPPWNEDRAELFVGLAAGASARGQAMRAARFAGVADALLAQTRAPMRFVRSRYDQVVAEIRNRLDAASFARSFADGQSLTLDDAIVYALADVAAA
jgi:hypothetical protein